MTIKKKNFLVNQVHLISQIHFRVVSPRFAKAFHVIIISLVCTTILIFIFFLLPSENLLALLKKFDFTGFSLAVQVDH